MNTKYILWVILLVLTIKMNAQNNNGQNPPCTTTDVVLEEEVIFNDFVPPYVSPPEGPLDDPCDFPEREVYWLHGFKGNATSWSNAEPDIESRFLVSSYAPDYSGFGGSLQTAANRVKQDVERSRFSVGENAYRNFVIAHSMGGVVGRQMGQVFSVDDPNNKAYDGLITFGTPHQGAYAADVLANDTLKIINFASHACSSLGAGPGLEVISNYNTVGKLVVTFANSLNLSTMLSDVVCPKLTASVFNLVETFIVDDVAAELTTANAGSIPSASVGHNAAFYGIEQDDDDDMAIKFAGTFIRNVNDFPLYEADASDLVGITAFTHALNEYVSGYTTFSGHQRDYWYDFFTLGIARKLRTSRNDNIAAAYKKGIDWFPTFNSSWKDLIGASEIRIEEQQGCHCTTYINGNVESENFYYGQDIDCSQYEYQGNSTWTDCQPTYAYVYVSFQTDKPSDAFILTESAANFPGANYKSEVMLGSNHFQMRNDSNTGRAMRDIFLNGLGGEYFKTCPR